MKRWLDIQLWVISNLQWSLMANFDWTSIRKWKSIICNISNSNYLFVLSTKEYLHANKIDIYVIYIHLGFRLDLMSDLLIITIIIITFVAVVCATLGYLYYMGILNDKVLHTFKLSNRRSTSSKKSIERSKRAAVFS